LRDLELIEQHEMVTVQRTRAGRHQRAAGAWSWFVSKPGDMLGCWLGSCEPAGKIIKAHREGRVSLYQPRYAGEPELVIE